MMTWCSFFIEDKVANDFLNDLDALDVRVRMYKHKREDFEPSFKPERRYSV